MSLQVVDSPNYSGGSPHLRTSPRRPPPAPLPGVGTSTAPSPLPSAALPSETPVPPTPTHGLLAQLNHLLPRHTLIHVRLHIHEIASVPLIAGEFGVRWKFKRVRAVPGSKSGLLGMVKTRNRSRHRIGQELEEQASARSIRTESEDGQGSGSGSGSGSPSLESSEDTPSIPSVVVSRHGYGPPSQPTSPISTLSPMLSPSASSSRIPTLTELSSRLYKSPEEQSTPSLAETTPVDGYSSSRGMTAYGLLREHKVVWEHKVDVVVKMAVERDTMQLLPSELKLEVMQRVIPNDPSSPQNPRLGVLYINLAQYASTSTVTRRYLLQKSKTNATLKLTIQLECVGGEKNFIAPPLPKGEILGGIKGVLDSDVIRLPPRIAGLERGMAAAMGGSVGIFSELGTVYGPGARRTDSDGVAKVKILDQEYSLDHLGQFHGPKITEDIIDMIFNPAPTTDKTKEGPFTYYVDPNEIMKQMSPSHALSSPSSVSLSRISHVAQADSASIYSNESNSSTSESVSEHSHVSRQSTSTRSTRSSLGIGLGVGLSGVGGGGDEQRRSSVGSTGSGGSEAATPEPSGRMKGWWKRIGHGHGHGHLNPTGGGSPSSSPMGMPDSLTPAASSSPAMPSIQITT